MLGWVREEEHGLVTRMRATINYVGTVSKFHIILRGELHWHPRMRKNHRCHSQFTADPVQPIYLSNGQSQISIIPSIQSHGAL